MLSGPARPICKKGGSRCASPPFSPSATPRTISLSELPEPGMLPMASSHRNQSNTSLSSMGTVSSAVIPPYRLSPATVCERSERLARDVRAAAARPSSAFTLRATPEFVSLANGPAPSSLHSEPTTPPPPPLSGAARDYRAPVGSLPRRHHSADDIGKLSFDADAGGGSRPSARPLDRAALARKTLAALEQYLQLPIPSFGGGGGGGASASAARGLAQQQLLSAGAAEAAEQSLPRVGSPLGRHLGGAAGGYHLPADPSSLPIMSAANPIVHTVPGTSAGAGGTAAAEAVVAHALVAEAERRRSVLAPSAVQSSMRALSVSCAAAPARDTASLEIGCIAGLMSLGQEQNTGTDEPPPPSPGA